MISPFTSWALSHRPDQTVDALNEMLEQIIEMKSQLRIVSKDKKNVIIIGNQPVNPQTGRPYSFGIHTYEIKGDRLEEI